MHLTGKKPRSIRWKLNFVVVTVALLSILLSGGATLGSSFLMRSQTLEINSHMGEQAASDSREMMESQALEQLQNLAASKAETVDAKLQAIISQVNILTGAAEELYAKPASFGRIPVSPADAATQGEYTAQIVYAERTEPSKVAKEVGLLGNLTIAMKESSQHLDGVGTTQIGTKSGFIIMCDENAGLKTGISHLEPTERSWYRGAVESGTITWSNVFEDSYGRGLAVTCGKPVYDPNGTLRAVVSIGSTLDDVSASITDSAIGKTGYAFVVDQNGDIIMSKNMEVNASGRVSQKENLLENSDETVRELAKKIIAGERGVAQCTNQGKPVYMAYEPMKNVNWSVVTVMDVDEVQEPSAASAASIQALTDQANQKIDALIRGVLLVLLVILVAAMLLSVGVGTGFSTQLTKPLLQLDEGVGRISEGNLDVHLEVNTGDEIEHLADSFNQMTNHLKEYIQNLTLVTAEKERIGAELDVAKHIQASMLPCIFPAFPERPELDIYATMIPAKEVGGDFYDFFLVDDDRLAMVMADVSGKGVPAALFMVIAKTLLKNVAQTGLSPKAVLEKVNNQLCVGNEAEMFVTVWLGILEISTGKMTCANAGHEYPVLRRVGGDYELIKDKHGFVLAGMEGTHYREYELQIEPGDRLFLYTDGVAEATDAQNTLYGTDRMLKALNRNKDADCETLLSLLKEDIDAFVGVAPQFDDITMLSLELIPQNGSGMKKLKLNPTLEAIGEVSAFVEQELESAGAPMKIIAQMNIAVDEIFSNIARYSGASDATVGVIVKDGVLTLRFADNGLPYDPTEKQDPDTTLSAEERDIGGLGIFMVKKSMDTVSYEYRDSLNILTLTKKI